MGLKRKGIIVTLGIMSTCILLTGCSPTFNREVRNNDITGKFSSSVFMSQEDRKAMNEQQKAEREEKKQKDEERKNKKNKNEKENENEYKWGSDRNK